jgi:polyisoprenoid-binding protein YceI
MTSTTSATELTGTWIVDLSASEATFTIRHAGAAKARGKIAITSASRHATGSRASVHA